MARILKITQIGARFVVECPNGRINILNERSLKINLKHVFFMESREIADIVSMLSDDGWTNNTVKINLIA